MKKLAEVLELNSNGTAKIRLYKHQKCNGCGLCNKTVHPGSVIDAENPINAGPDDFVEAELKKHFSLFDFFFLYAIGPIMFALFFFIGMQIWPAMEDGAKVVILAFTVLIVCLVVSYVYRRKHVPIYTATIIKRV